MAQNMTLTVNQLPVQTWNWLGMNKSLVSVSVPMRQEWKLQRPEQVHYTQTAQRNVQVWDKLDEQEKCPIDMIELPAGITLSSPIQISLSYEAGQQRLNRVLITAQEGAQGDVIIDLSGGGQEAGMAALSLQVQLEQGAKLRIFQVQRLGGGMLHLCDISGTCKEQAQLELMQLQLGGASVYSGGEIKLEGKESRVQAELGYWGRGEQKLDFNYVVRHIGEKSQSQMTASGILQDRAWKLFRGTIDFQQGAKGAQGEEQENVLLLGERIVNQTIPLILCGEEDVQGNHGATIGQLDEEMLFYFGARGISQEQAQRMLSHSRMEALYRRIPQEDLVSKVAEFLDQEVET